MFHPCSFFVPGQPIAGEDAREQAWRARVIETALAAAAPLATGVILAFTLSRARLRVDVDNLARPALDALRDAGVLTRGFRGLDAVLAVKRTGERTGLMVTATTAEDVRQAAPPGEALLTVTAESLPRESQRDTKLRWRDEVAAAWRGQQVLGAPVFVDAVVSTHLSLKDVLKPILDGLEPVRGRDVRAHLEFVPDDDLVTWLRVVRTTAPPAVVLRLGPHMVRAHRAVNPRPWWALCIARA